MINQNFNKYIFIILIAIGFISSSCSDKSKEILNPIFDLAVDLSLSDREYNMGEIIRRQDQIAVDSGSFLLKFSTDEIKKDTTIDAFFADIFNLDQDTTFQVLVSDTISVEMIVRRDSIRVDEAEFDGGLIVYQFTNYSSKNSEFKLILPGFTKNVGGSIDTLKIGGLIPGNQSVNYQNNLEGYVYKQPPTQPFGSTRPGFWIKGKLILAGGSPGDSIKIFSDVQNLRFKRMKGRFKPLSLGKKEQTFENLLASDISDVIQKITFDSINVKIVGKTSIDLPIRLNKFEVAGIFKSGAPKINLRFGSATAFDTVIAANATTTLNFNNVNTDINSFLAKSPDSIKIISEIILNPTYVAGEVLSKDSISFSFDVDAWSKFSIDNADFTDTLEVDFGTDARDKIAKGKSGSITIYFNNLIPLEAELIGLLTDSLYRPLMYITRNMLTSSDSVVKIGGAFINSDGRVISPNIQTVKVDLTQSDILKLKDAYFLIQKFSLSTTDKRIVYLSSKDKINVRITGNVRVQFNSDDF
ncbi:MAG: hypothetical protein FJ213_12260 [Ignavibacteria bacterium]|nr:hypothetical protein [Ignavibacteria bacterium]